MRLKIVIEKNTLNFRVLMSKLMKVGFPSVTYFSGGPQGQTYIEIVHQEDKEEVENFVKKIASEVGVSNLSFEHRYT